MNGIIVWFAKHHIVLNLLILFVLVTGVLIMPKFSMTVSMTYGLAYGIGFAVMVTLIFVPLCYAILHDLTDRFKIAEEENLFDFTSTTDIVKKIVHADPLSAYAFNNSDVFFDDVPEEETQKNNLQQRSRLNSDDSVDYLPWPETTFPDKKEKNVRFNAEPLNTDELLAEQENSELDKIFRAIEEEVYLVNHENHVRGANKGIISEIFDNTSNFETLIQNKLNSFKFITRFSEINIVVPLSDEFDYYVYQISLAEEVSFKQYRIPDAHGQFFERVLQSPQIQAVNKNNRQQFEMFMSHEMQRFIAAQSFLIMSVYLMDNPLGIIYAVPEDPQMQCSSADYEEFQCLVTHLYKGIETMVDIV